MKRLKIAEQIVIVLFFAVLIPFITIGLIISNISQQTVRKELVYSSKMISGFVGDSVQNYIKFANEELRQVASAISFFYYEDDKNDFLNEIEYKYGKFNNFKVLDSDTLKNRDPLFDSKNSTIKLYANINSEDVISADLRMAILQDALDNKFSDLKHDIYVLDGRGNIVATNDHDNNGYQDIIKNLPKNRQYLTPVLFSQVKNQPLAYFQLQNP